MLQNSPEYVEGHWQSEGPTQVDSPGQPPEQTGSSQVSPVHEPKTHEQVSGAEQVPPFSQD